MWILSQVIAVVVNIVIVIISVQKWTSKRQMAVSCSTCSITWLHMGKMCAVCNAANLQWFTVFQNNEPHNLGLRKASSTNAPDMGPKGNLRVVVQLFPQTKVMHTQYVIKYPTHPPSGLVCCPDWFCSYMRQMVTCGHGFIAVVPPTHLTAR